MKSFSRLLSFQLWFHLLWSGTLIRLLLTPTALWLHTSCSFISPLICFLSDHLTFCPFFFSCSLLIFFYHFFNLFSALLCSLSFLSVLWPFWLSLFLSFSLVLPYDYVPLFLVSSEFLLRCLLSFFLPYLLSSSGFTYFLFYPFAWLTFSSLTLFLLHSVMFLQFVPKTHLFFTAGKDKKIKQWDADKFEHIQTLEVTLGFIPLIFATWWLRSSVLWQASFTSEMLKWNTDHTSLVSSKTDLSKRESKTRLCAFA